MKTHHSLGIIALAPLLYALSVGPVIMIDRIVNQPSWGIPSTGVLLFYRPLEWFCERVPPAGRMLQSYTNLWLPH
jgi:hypothetical protein